MTSLAHKDHTFRSYNAVQAAAYASGRNSYNPQLYETILAHHKRTGGRLDMLLDVGCGPGNATRDIAPKFEHAIGIDPSAEMINAARSVGGFAREEAIRYETLPAEECASIPDVEAGSVDLITAAMAAHWFDMNVFWQQAARALRPGGTVALWTVASLYCHPSMPNAPVIQEILFDLERRELSPYETESNRISSGMYDKLELPWTVQHPVSDFPREAFTRHDWNRDGVIAEDGVFFSGCVSQSLEDFGAGLATSSMVTRWREANPRDAHTDRDCVNRTIALLRQALGARGFLSTGGGTALLLFKKHAT